MYSYFVTAHAYSYVHLHIKWVPHLLQISILYNKKEQRIPATNCTCAAAQDEFLRKENFRDLPWVLFTLRQSVLFYSAKYLWKYSLEIPHLFILVISGLEFMKFRILNWWPFFTKLCQLLIPQKRLFLSNFFVMAIAEVYGTIPRVHLFGVSNLY